MKLKESTSLKFCYPCCCFGTTDANTMAFLIICWDVLVNFCWITFSLWTVRQIGWLPIVFAFISLLFIVLVIYDLRNKHNLLQLSDCYNYFRLFGAIVLLILAVVCFIFLIVFATRPEAQTNNFTTRFMIFYLFICLILGGTHLATVFKFREAIRQIKSSTFYQNNQEESGIQGIAMTQPLSQLERTLSRNEVKI